MPKKTKKVDQSIKKINKAQTVINDIEKKKIKNKKEDTFSDNRQFALFLTGFALAGLLLISTIVDIIAQVFISDKDLINTVVNDASYIILAIILLAICLGSPKVFGKKLGKPASYFIGIGIGILAIAIEIGVGILISQFHEVTVNENQAAINSQFLNYPTISFIVMCVIGPFCEELTYRVGLYDLIKRRNKFFAILISVLVFASLHINFLSENLIDELWSLPTYIAIGLVLTLAYDKHDFPCSLIAHITINSASFAATLLLPLLQ